MDLTKYRDKVNINLIKCIYKLRKQIMDIYQIKQMISEDNCVNNSDIKFVAIKSEEGYENLQFLTSSLTRLSNKLKALRIIYTTTPEDTFNQDALSDYDLDLKNELNVHLVTTYLESQIDNLIRYASCVLQIYKIDETSENCMAVKKCLISLNKEVKTVLFTVYDKRIKPEFISELNSLCEKILVLSRKVSKITSKYIQKFFNGVVVKDEKSDFNNETSTKDNDVTPKKKKKKSSIHPNLPNCETASNSDVQDYVVKKGDLSLTSNENLNESMSDSSFIRKSKKRKNKTEDVEDDFKTPKKKIKRDKTPERDVSKSNADSPKKKKSKSTCLGCENKRCEIHPELYKTKVEFVNVTLENVNLKNDNRDDGNYQKKSKFREENNIVENNQADVIKTKNNFADKINIYNKENNKHGTSNKKLEKNNNKENLNDTKKTSSKTKELKQSNLLDSFITKTKTIINDSTREINLNKSIKSEIRNSISNEENDLSDEDYDLTDEEHDETNEDIKPNIRDLSDDEKFLQVQVMLEEAEDQRHLSDEIKSQLEVLYIQPTWEIPESHQIETRLCIGPTKEQKQELLKHNIICGLPFTKIEDKTITKNFAKFCKEYDFNYDATPFLVWQTGKTPIMPHTERVKFVQYIGQNLPNRMLSSIYRRFKVLYSPVKKGRFTKEEDDIILTFAKNARGAKKNEPKFAPLVKVLNRSRPSIQTRYKCLMEEKQDKIKWDQDLDTKLLVTLMRLLDIEDYKELRDREIEHSIFEQIGLEMDLTAMKVKVHWLKKLYTQLFSPNPIRYDKLKVQLIEKLIELRENDWRSVNWQKVATYFDGCSSHFLAFVAKIVIRHNVPPEIHKDLKKCLRHLKEKFDNGIPISGKKGFLSRYRFVNNTLMPCK